MIARAEQQEQNGFLTVSESNKSSDTCLCAVRGPSASSCTAPRTYGTRWPHLGVPFEVPSINGGVGPFHGAPGIRIWSVNHILDIYN